MAIKINKVSGVLEASTRSDMIILLNDYLVSNPMDYSDYQGDSKLESYFCYVLRLFGEDDDIIGINNVDGCMEFSWGWSE